MRAPSKKVKLNAMLFARMVKMLLYDNPTTQDICDELGFAPTTVQRYLNEIRKERALHVKDWLPDQRGADTIAVWKLGRGRDAPRRPKTRAQIMEAYRQRKKQQALLQRMAG